MHRAERRQQEELTLVGDGRELDSQTSEQERTAHEQNTQALLADAALELRRMATRIGHLQSALDHREPPAAVVSIRSSQAADYERMRAELASRELQLAQVTLQNERLAADLQFHLAERQDSLLQSQSAHRQLTTLVVDLQQELVRERTLRRQDHHRDPEHHGENQQIVDLEARLGNLAERISDLEGKNSRLQESLADRLTTINELREQQLQLSMQIDLSTAQNAELHLALAASEADRADRLTVINKLSEQQLQSSTRIDASNAENAELRLVLAASEADRADRLTLINELSEQQLLLTACVSTFTEECAELRQALASSEADRAARLSVIEHLDAQAQHLAAQLTDAKNEAGRLRVQLEVGQADRSAQSGHIQTLSALCRQGEAANSIHTTALAGLSQHVAELSDRLLSAHSDSTAREAAHRELIERLQFNSQNQQAENHRLRESLQLCEADRAARLSAIEELTQAVAQLEASRAVRWARSVGRFVTGRR